jgi:guanylate kinase
MIGTAESFSKTKNYYGENVIVPIYIEVDDGIRLERALKREQLQKIPKYDEMCRRFLADQQDFSDDKLIEAGIGMRFQNDNLENCILQVSKYISKAII